ncbi:MAG: TetR/AcrR family transcriptional regulator [Thermoleophilia bacterium]|jgi:AcrR family transcriptional regulator
MTRTVQTFSSVREPCQQRSRDSLERILKSAEALIRTKGYESLTIAEVVRHSRTSIGTFYARFPDKTALLYAVHERVLERQEEELKTRLAEVPWQTLSLEEAIRRLVAIKNDRAKGNEKLYEAFVVSGATDGIVRERGYRSKAAEEDLEVEIIMQHADEIVRDQPEQAVRIACRLWQAAQEENVQRLKSGVPGAGGVPQNTVMEEIADVVIAYLKQPTSVMDHTGTEAVSAPHGEAHAGLTDGSRR